MQGFSARPICDFMSTPSWAIEHADGFGALTSFQLTCDAGPCGQAIGAPESWGGFTPFEPWRYYSSWEAWAADVDACLACFPYDDEQIGEIRAGLARSRDCWPCKDRAKSASGSFVLPGVAARLEQAGANPQATPWLASQQIAAPSPAELSTLAKTFTDVAPPSQGGSGAPGTGAWSPGSPFIAAATAPPLLSPPLPVLTSPSGAAPSSPAAAAPAGPVAVSSPGLLSSLTGATTAASGGISIFGYRISYGVLAVIAVGVYLFLRK